MYSACAGVVTDALSRAAGLLGDFTPLAALAIALPLGAMVVRFARSLFD